MTVTKTQVADAYSAALNEILGEEWDYQFSRKDANKFLDLLWPVIADPARPTRPPQDELQGSHQGQKGHQPFHWRADHFQGQARDRTASLHCQ